MNTLKGLSLVLIFALFLSSAARADDQEKKQGLVLQPVTVTAQKREENVQEVPVSVGVLDSVTLEEQRITEFLDLSGVTPNLYMAGIGSPTDYAFVGIRGRINSGVDLDPTVTVMVDGVPLSDFYTMAANLLFDIERVEVLRGPQSTMYGLNSTAGVINIVTKKPGDSLHYGFSSEGSAGPDFDGSYTLNGSLSGPLVEETLSAGVAFMSKKNGGYIKNNYSGDLYNSDSSYGGRGSLVWTPSKDWDITLGASYAEFDSDASHVYVPMTDAAAAAMGMDKKKWENNLDKEGFGETQSLSTNLSMTYDAGPMEVVSVSTYSQTDLSYQYDGDASTGGFAYFANVGGDTENYSQELRLQSQEDEDSPLEWLVGYYFYQFERNQTFGSAFNATPSAVTPGLDTRLRGNSHALFGQATYRLLDRKLGLTIGIRQEWTSRELLDRLNVLPDLDTTDSQFLPKFAVDYRFTPEIMGYASATMGWRTGGLNNLSPYAGRAFYEKETSWTYEVGAKTQFLDNRLLLNLALFHTVYDDYQDMIYVTGTETYLLNAGEVTMTGLELDGQAQLLDNLLLTMGFGYVAGEYQDHEDANGNYAGNTVISAPDWNLSVALKYSFLDGFYVRPEMRGVGTIYWDRLNEEKQVPYFTFNLRAGYAKDAWEVYLFGENLTNEYRFTQATDAYGEWYGIPVKPFRAGVGISYRF